MTNIIIYSKTHCPYCVKAKNLLDSKQASYTEINIEHDSNFLTEMLEKSNGARTVPQIFIDDQHIGGFDDLYALNQQGKLDKLL